MPQVDLVSACSGGVSSCHNDRKIACETLADDDPPASDQPDFPADSFFLSAGAELDWIDRNAFIERKESAEGGISLHSVNINPIENPLSPPNNPAASNSGSQRYSLNVKSKPSIIGLMKPQKSANYAEAKKRRPASIRLFPKRSNSSSSKSGRKSAVAAAEPSSPKVSCIGRVRSRKDRSRRKKIGRQKKSEPAITRSKSQKGGFWNSFRSIFRSRARKQPKGNEPDMIEPPAADPPPLGVVKRFSSARRSDAWAADLENNGAKSEPLDRPISIGTVKRFPSGRRSDAWAGDLYGGGVKSEPSDRPTIGAVKRFSSARRSDAWAADLEGDDGEQFKPSDPPSLGAVKRFSSGRRSDAWAGDLEVEGAKSEPLDHISILQRRIGGGLQEQDRIVQKSP